jgi:hypothetical protein
MIHEAAASLTRHREILHFWIAYWCIRLCTRQILATARRQLPPDDSRGRTLLTRHRKILRHFQNTPKFSVLSIFDLIFLKRKTTTNCHFAPMFFERTKILGSLKKLSRRRTFYCTNKRVRTINWKQMNDCVTLYKFFGQRTPALISI